MQFYPSGESNVLQYELEYANLTEEEKTMTFDEYKFSTVGIRVLMDRRVLYIAMNVYAPSALLVFVSMTR